MKGKLRSKELLLFILIFIIIFIYFIYIIKNDFLYNYSLKSINKKYEYVKYNTLLNNYVYKEKKEIKNIKNNIYIYNTHYKEEYVDTNVIEMSKLLCEKLNNNNLYALCEDTNLDEYILINNMVGINNYPMIRNIIINKIDSDMDLIIDLHRDSLNKKDSTVEINNKKYAKILFVVDSTNKEYKKNYEFSKYLDNLIKDKYKNISRGIYVKEGFGFNQDLSDKMILLELGGYENSKEELENTIDIIVQVIGEYINAK